MTIPDYATTHLLDRFDAIFKDGGDPTTPCEQDKRKQAFRHLLVDVENHLPDYIHWRMNVVAAPWIEHAKAPSILTQIELESLWTAIFEILRGVEMGTPLGSRTSTINEIGKRVHQLIQVRLETARGSKDAGIVHVRKTR
jgi:hypothetical protein